VPASAEVASRARPGVVDFARFLVPAGGLPLLLGGVDSSRLRDEFIQLRHSAGQTVKLEHNLLGAELS
jgi:hypothetical protein